MSRIQIRLTRIHCIETEDDLGNDEFYVVSAFKKNSDAKPVVEFKGIWSMSDGLDQPVDEQLVDETVDTGEEAYFRIWCFDRDAAEEISQADIKKAEEMVAEMLQKIESHRESNGKGPNTGIFLADLALGAIFSIIAALVNLDKDDLLGDHTETIPTPTWWQAHNPIGTSSATHITPFKCRYDGAQYDVEYEVKVIF
jgi:hypothetical protein